VKWPRPRGLYKQAAKCLRLKSYLDSPGDGRSQTRLPAGALRWALWMGVLLRRGSFACVEALVRSPARRALGVSRRFGNHALPYFSERLDPADTESAALTAVRQSRKAGGTRPSTSAAPSRLAPPCAPSYSQTLSTPSIPKLLLSR